MNEPIKEKLVDFLDADFSSAARAKRFWINGSKILYAIFRDLTDGQLSLRAMSLVYTTLITLVPLLAISFSVLKGFGVHNQIEPWLLGYLAPLGEKAADIAKNIVSFVDNIKVGVLGFLGLALLIYSVIALMQKIEAAFNFIWRVSKSRTLARRFSDYLSVLLFGPFLIFLSAGLTTAARNTSFINIFADMPLMETAFSMVSVFVPYLVMTLGFTFFYIYMPNTRVRLKAAFTGGLFAALLWKVMGWIFSNVIAASATYVAVYAAFATLIIFMVWVYLSWLVILMGANIAFYMQHPKYIRLARKDVVLSNRMRTELGLSILEILTQRQYKNAAPLNADGLAERFHLPVIAVQNMLDALEQGDIITLSASDKGTLYYPARPLDEMTLGQVWSALATYSEKTGMRYERLEVEPKTAEIREEMQKALDPLFARTIKDIYLDKDKKS